MSKIEKAPIIDISMLNDSICKIVIESYEITKISSPGQFLNIRCGESYYPLVRRPISICDVDKDLNTITLIIHLKANGTKLLSKLSKGDFLDVIGPLGKGFDLNDKYKNILVVGGGIGTFPLLYLLNESKSNFKGSILGFRTKDLIVLEDEFKSVSDKIKIYTDDGTYGKKGLVTDEIVEFIKDNNIQIIYACGPNPMLKGIANISKEINIPCQISIEQRMACGIGACLVCACKTKASNEEGFEYKHVCKDGPVFWAEDVIFE